MLAQVEGQAMVDGIDELGLLQNQITTPHDGPKVVLDNLGKHAVWGRLGTNPDGSGTLLTLRHSLKELSKII